MYKAGSNPSDHPKFNLNIIEDYTNSPVETKSRINDVTKESLKPKDSHQPISNLNPVKIEKIEIDPSQSVAVARSKLESLMENKETRQSVQSEFGTVITKPTMNTRSAYLASIKNTVYFYEKSIQNSHSSSWTKHCATKLFSKFSITNSLTQDALSYYELAISMRSKEEIEKLNDLEKKILYAGPIEGGLYRSESSLKELPGVEMDFPEGRYTGIIEDGMPEGKGKMEFHDGAVYIGAFKEGRPHGEGSLTLPDQTVLAGKFVHGQLSR